MKSAVDFIVENNKNYPTLPSSWQELYQIMDAYAEHCEETAWVKDGSLPPFEKDSTTVSVDVFTMISSSDKKDMISNWYDFTSNKWVKADKYVESWRLYPALPKE